MKLFRHRNLTATEQYNGNNEDKCALETLKNEDLLVKQPRGNELVKIPLDQIKYNCSLFITAQRCVSKLDKCSDFAIPDSEK